MGSLCVATFNIHHCLGVDGRLSLQRTADVIKATGAPIVGLQEIDRFWSRSGSVDQAAELEQRTGMHMAFHRTFTDGRAEYGIGLLSSEPLRTSFTSLPRLTGDEPRGFIEALAEGVTVFVTHLSRLPEARPAQIEALLDAVEASPPPVILMGDLNETRRGVRRLTQAGLLSGDRHVTTFPRFGWGRQIDFVFAGRGARVLRSRTLWTAASDHLPVVTEVDLPAPFVKEVKYC